MDIQRAIDYFENEVRVMKKYNVNLDCVEFCETAISAMQELQQYRQIGTPEECREDREKQIPVSVEYRGSMWIKCRCGMVVGRHKYCPECGQALKRE